MIKQKSNKLGTESWAKAEKTGDNLVSDHQKIRDLRGAMRTEGNQKQDSKGRNMKE
jgi:hypothetical protein